MAVPRSTTPEERRQHILQTAATLFAQKGIHETSMDDIVQATGLSKGSLYWYFHNREDLLLTLLQLFLDQELQLLQSVQEQEGPASERLYSMLERYIQQLAQAAHLLPVTLDFYAMATRQEKIRHFFQSYYQRFRLLVKEILQQGLVREEFLPFDPDEISIALIALLEGTTLLGIIEPEHIQLEKHALPACRFLLESLKKPS
uniref:TetR family transcriptional regulator n=1 Tax=Thermosporothrix sp. COM3 TaxID=2490863 RepID=A0A455SD26_9CHLR|nr:TetR family transcriptional regulator [Thermosporothrix sp. COM3]